MTDTLNHILNNLKIPVIVWTDNICTYTNNLICKKSVSLDEYLESNKIDNYKYFLDIIKTSKISQDIRLPDKTISLEYIAYNKYYEIHYPATKYYDILFIVVYKLRKALTNILTALPDSKDTEEVRSIKLSCYNMMHIINDLIDIININKRKLVRQEKFFNLDHLIKECYKIIEDDASDKNISVHISICDKVNGNYYDDYDKIKQVILNIIYNGVKFSRFGGITIDVKEYIHDLKCPYHIKKNNKTNILFRIKDSGIGMDDSTKEIIDNLLNIPGKNNQFQKKDKTNGFGLFISYHLCSFLNGHMWYNSEKDVGTVFYIVIPIQEHAH